MSKRYNPLQIQSTSKKPKIDTIQIPPRLIHDILDDGDDEWLVNISSQVEQNVIPKITEPVAGTSSSQNNQSAFTDSFNGFVNGANCRTSTQLQPKRFVPGSIDDPHRLGIYDPVEEDLLLSQFNYEEKLIELEKQKKERQALRDLHDKQEQENNSGVFKVPSAPSKNEESGLIPPSQMKVAENVKPILQKRREKAMELRMKFLETRLQVVEDEKNRTMEKIEQVTKQIETKDNELESLRYEYKMAKSAADRLRQEKLTDMERINKEWMDRVGPMEKKLKLFQAQLAEKEAKLMNASFAPKSDEKDKIEEPNNSIVLKKGKPFEKVKRVATYEMRLFKVPELPMKPHTNLLKVCTKEQIRKGEWCHREFTGLSLGISKLYLSSTQLEDERDIQDIIDDVIPVVERFIRFFGFYCDNLPVVRRDEFPRYPEKEINHFIDVVEQFQPFPMCDSHEHPLPTIYDPEANVLNEPEKILRRCFALIADLCRIKNFTGTMLTNEMNFFEKLIISIKKVARSNEYTLCSVFMTAMTIMAIEIFRAKEHPNADLFFKFIKTLIFCRVESIDTLNAHTTLLKTIAEMKDASFLDKFCQNMSTASYNVDIRKGVVYVKESCCALFMLGVCFETVLHFNWPIKNYKKRILFQMATNLTDFLEYSVFYGVSWIKEKPSHEDNPTEVCPCFAAFMCGYVVILSAALKILTDKNPKIVRYEELYKLSRRTVLLLEHIMLHYDRYKVSIFSYCGGSSTFVKSCFKEITFLLNKYQKESEYKKTHCLALEFLNNPKILSEFEKEVELGELSEIIIEKDQPDVIDMKQIEQLSQLAAKVRLGSPIKQSPEGLEEAENQEPQQQEQTTEAGVIAGDENMEVNDENEEKEPPLYASLGMVHPDLI